MALSVLSTKKAAVGFIFILFLTVLANTSLVYWASANPTSYASSGSQNVYVSIESPANKTYNTNDILVTVTAGGFPGIVYVRYSVDDGPSIDLDPINWWGHNFSASVLLKQLPQGSHKLVAKSKVFETPEVCSTVYFTVTEPLEPTPSSSPTPSSGFHIISLAIKVQGIASESGVSSLEFSVYVPYEIKRVYNCNVTAGYRTISNEWRTTSKNIGTVNYGDYRMRQLPLGEGIVTEDPEELMAFLESVKIEGYGYSESPAVPSSQPPQPIPIPSSQPSQPIPTPTSEPFPMTFVTAVGSVIAVATVVCLGLLVYLKKLNRAGKHEK